MKNKFYTVWTGRQIGVFASWDECRLQVEGFPGARYKGFPTREAAESAFKSEPDFSSDNETKISWETLPEGTPKPDPNAIAVDAACSGNPGKMEYRGDVHATVFHFPRITVACTSPQGQRCSKAPCLKAAPTISGNFSP